MFLLYGAYGDTCTLPVSIGGTHVANMGPTWVLSSPGGPHAGPMKLVIRGGIDLRMKKGRMRKRNKYAISYVTRGNIVVYIVHFTRRWVTYITYRILCIVV